MIKRAAITKLAALFYFFLSPDKSILLFTNLLVSHLRSKI